MNELLQQAIDDIAAGKPVVVVDDQKRENEADVIIAAQKATAQSINFMITHARGLVCLTITPQQAQQLALPLMVQENSSRFKTNFTVSIEARHGISTGISAQDRAYTIATAMKPDATPADLSRPGHIFPLVADPHGVLGRPGHTEASIELARLAGLTPAGVICEVLNEQGSSATGNELERFAATHKLTMIAVSDIINHRLCTEVLVERVATTGLPTQFGHFTVHAYRDTLTNHEHLALTVGALDHPLVLCRIHSSCATGDIFGSKRCDCQAQLHRAMDLIQKNGSGILIYLDQEGRGIGLTKKIQAYALQDGGIDTVDANLALGHQPDERHYWAAGSILKDLAVPSIELLTNNPQKVNELIAGGINVQRKSINIQHNRHNVEYLKTKKNKLGHLL